MGGVSVWSWCRRKAKDFTTSKQGGVNKFKYCRRNFFWDIICVHVAAGYKAIVAID
jgi:hypothetical protein